MIHFTTLFDRTRISCRRCILQRASQQATSLLPLYGEAITKILSCDDLISMSGTALSIVANFIYKARAKNGVR
ncbi:MAG: hypothetical protein ONA90_06790 [candidate division KSB1 bacterium]|nr:hypothetical protein [candidate division KSB1 bacterium]